MAKNLMVTRWCHPENEASRCDGCIINESTGRPERVRVCQMFCGSDRMLADKVSRNWSRYGTLVEEPTAENLAKLTERARDYVLGELARLAPPSLKPFPVLPSVSTVEHEACKRELHVIWSKYGMERLALALRDLIHADARAVEQYGKFPNEVAWKDEIAKQLSIFGERMHEDEADDESDTNYGYDKASK